MQLQARVGVDQHTCVATYGVPAPIVPLPGPPCTVLVNSIPAARICDLGSPIPPPGHPFPKGSLTVLITNIPALRILDPCPSAGAVTVVTSNVVTGG